MKLHALLFACALWSLGCSGVMESKVRTVAAKTFSCADYAVDVTEVGPYLYRAAGCQQELIYACHPSEGLVEPDPMDEIMGDGTDPVAVCTRRP